MWQRYMALAHPMGFYPIKKSFHDPTTGPRQIKTIVSPAVLERPDPMCLPAIPRIHQAPGSFLIRGPRDECLSN
jgi:hypothetical protein